MKDQVIADKLVKIGVLEKSGVMYHLLPTDQGTDDPSVILNDWRVAGECLERMDEHHPCCVWIEAGVRFARMGAYYSIGKRRYGSAEGFAHAICEAFAAAHDGQE